jgi:uncharacterized membrane protein YfcA
MILGVPAGEIAILAAAIVAGGFMTGLLAGLFGVGGGAIIVPVLYEIFRVMEVPDVVRMQLCVGTSLAIIVPTSIRSFRAHLARGTLPTGILKIWLGPIVAGVVAGSLLAAVAPGALFTIAFIVMASLIAAKLLFARETWRLGSELPGRGLMTLYGFVIGLYSSLMGVGGGALSTIILTLYGQTIHTAVGISAGIGMIISGAGAIGFMLAGLPHQALLPPLSLGFVSLIGLALMAPISSLVAPLGARLAHALPKRRLELLFALFLLTISARFLVSLVW